MPLCALAILLMFQQPVAPEREPSEQDKQVTTLVAQIRRLAVSEPVVFGIDTRMRTADVLTGKYPKLAKELLRDAQSALTGATEPADQDRLRVRLAGLLAPLDMDEAERSIKSIRHGREQDYVAQAYDKLVVFLAPYPWQARRMIGKGLGAGAFRMTTASRSLAELEAVDAADAAALFSEMLAAFP